MSGKERSPVIARARTRKGPCASCRLRAIIADFADERSARQPRFFFFWGGGVFFCVCACVAARRTASHRRSWHSVSSTNRSTGEKAVGHDARNRRVHCTCPAARSDLAHYEQMREGGIKVVIGGRLWFKIPRWRQNAETRASSSSSVPGGGAAVRKLQAGVHDWVKRRAGVVKSRALAESSDRRGNPSLTFDPCLPDRFARS